MNYIKYFTVFLFSFNFIFLEAKTNCEGKKELWNECFGKSQLEAGVYEGYFSNGLFQGKGKFFLDEVNEYLEGEFDRGNLISGTYYFVSRVIHAREASLQNQAPSYDSAINQ